MDFKISTSYDTLETLKDSGNYDEQGQQNTYNTICLSRLYFGQEVFSIWLLLVA